MEIEARRYERPEELVEGRTEFPLLLWSREIAVELTDDERMLRVFCGHDIFDQRMGGGIFPNFRDLFCRQVPWRYERLKAKAEALFNRLHRMGQALDVPQPGHLCECIATSPQLLQPLRGEELFSGHAHHHHDIFVECLAYLFVGSQTSLVARQHGMRVRLHRYVAQRVQPGQSGQETEQ